MSLLSCNILLEKIGFNKTKETDIFSNKPLLHIFLFSSANKELESMMDIKKFKYSTDRTKNVIVVFVQELNKF